MMAEKNKPQPIDSREAELVEEMRLDVMDWIHGKASEGIVKSYKESTDTALTTGALAYKATKIAATNQQRFARAEMDMDMMLGVVTEAIDMLTEVAETAKVIPPGTDMTRLREDSLLRATTIHGETLENTGPQKGFSPDQKAAAQADLRDYMSDGGTQKAFDYVNRRAHADGQNPYDMMRAGNEAVFGAKHPLRDGIKKGLMDTTPRPLPANANTDRGGAVDPALVDDMATRQSDLAFSAQDNGPTPLMPPPDMPRKLPAGEGISPNPDNPPTTRPGPDNELAPARRF